MLKTCRSFLFSCLPITMLIMTGCGGSGTDPEEVKFIAELVSVSGTVSLNGDPLANATIQFVPTAKSVQGRAATGVTDAKGAYTLHTTVPSMDAEKTMGALKGDYRVVISKIVLSNGDPVPEGTTDADAMAEGAKEFVPQKFSDYERTTLTTSITGENKTLNFEL